MAAQQDTRSTIFFKDGFANFCPDDSLDILLVGRTGDGKSEAGNSILRRETFQTSAGTQSTTKIAQYDLCYFEDNYIKVVDCPGLGDTRLNAREDVQQFIDAMKVAMAYNPKGYHAFLYVVKFGEKFTQVDDLKVSNLKRILGENFIRNHCIILMTFGDCFKTDPDVAKLGLTFEKWVRKQKNNYFVKFLRECDQRIVLFDNKTNNKIERYLQVKKLIDIVLALSKRGRRYTNEDFKKVDAKRQRLIIELSKEKEKQDVMDYFGILISKINEASDDESGAVILSGVNQEIDSLFISVQQKVITNKMLKNTNELFKSIRIALQAKQKQVANIIGFDKELKKKREEWDLKIAEYKKRNSLALSHRNAKEREKRENIHEKEIEFNDIDSEIRKLEITFNTTREMDKSETNDRIRELEKMYIYIKCEESYSYIDRLIAFITKSILTIRKLFGLINGDD